MPPFELHSHEQHIETFRQTVWILFKPAIVALAVVSFPWYFLWRYELHIRFRTVLLIWGLLWLLYFLNKWLVWFMNSYVLTNIRLVTIHFRTIFHKIVVETPLERILNISYETPGVFPSLLNYGDVNVQIMGLAEPIALRHIRHPSRVKDYLWHVHSEYVEENSRSLRENPGAFQPMQAIKQKK